MHCIHTCMFYIIYTCVYIYNCTRMHVCLHVYIYAYIHIICMYVYIYVCVCLLDSYGVLYSLVFAFCDLLHIPLTSRGPTVRDPSISRAKWPVDGDCASPIFTLDSFSDLCQVIPDLLPIPHTFLPLSPSFAQIILMSPMFSTYTRRNILIGNPHRIPMEIAMIDR